MKTKTKTALVPAKSDEAGKPLSDPAPTLVPAKPSEAGIQYHVERGQRIPLDKIRVVSNTRTEFGGPQDEELLASVQLHGILASLWLRKPIENPGADYFELIAGERRVRAGIAAGIADAPADIYHVTPQVAKELQIIENLQRKDISPIDEAQGYRALLKDHGYTVEQLITVISKSKSYVFCVMKLADLCDLGVQLVRAGQMPASVAIRVARIPDKKLQLQCIKDDLMEDGDCVTDREAAAIIAERYQRELKAAPFDREDPTLSELGPCSTCSYRSGNQAELFPDLAKGRADVCTNPVCYAQKCKAGAQKALDFHKTAGGKLLSAAELKKVFNSDGHLSYNSGYIGLDDFEYLNGKRTELAALVKGFNKAPGSEPPIAITMAGIQDETGQVKLVQLVTRADAKKLYEAAAKVKSSANGSKPAAITDARKKELFEEKVTQNLRIAIIKRIAADIPDVKYDLAFWRVLALEALSHAGADGRKLCTRALGLDPKVLNGYKDHEAPLKAFTTDDARTLPSLAALTLMFLVAEGVRWRDLTSDGFKRISGFLAVGGARIKDAVRADLALAAVEKVANRGKSKSTPSTKSATSKPKPEAAANGAASRSRRRKLSPQEHKDGIW